MSARHLAMGELLALRDGDRSEPAFLSAQEHLEGCASCRVALEQLHQRTAHLRALPQLAPAVNVFPAVRSRLAEERTQRYWRRAMSFGVAAAAALVVWVVGSNLTHPAPLNAAEEIAEVKSSSKLLEQRLEEWNPDQRALDGRTVIVVIGLEDRIAEIDQQIRVVELRASATASSTAWTTVRLQSGQRDQERLVQELRLWRERERLMDALLKVHVNRAVQVEF